MCALAASLLGSFQSRGTLKEVGISCSLTYGGLPVRFWQGYLQWSMCLRCHAGVSAQENNIWRTQLVVVVTVGTGFQTLQDMNILAVLPHTDSKASFWLVTDCLLFIDFISLAFRSIISCGRPFLLARTVPQAKILSSAKS